MKGSTVATFLKTGCRVERIQLKTGQAVINAVMIYAVIGWQGDTLRD